MVIHRTNPLWFLTVIGLATFSGHLAFLAYFPLNKHVGAFLGIYAALCLLSAATAFWLKRNASGLAASSPLSQAALPWLILGFAACFRLILIWGPPVFSTDIYRYVWDGRVQLAGINPYVYPPSAAELAPLRDPPHALINNPEFSTIYPPLAQWAFRLAAAAAPTVLSQKITFVLFDLLTVWVLLKLLSLRGASQAWAVLYAWHPLPIVEFAGSGHLDSLMLFCLVTGLYLLGKGRSASGSAALAAAALAKIVPLVMIPWILAQSRSLAAIYFGTLAACSLPFLPGLWEASRQGLPLWTGAKAYADGWLANPSLFAVSGLVVSDPSLRKLLLGGVLAAFSIPWALINKQRPARFALGCLYALLLCSSVVQPWYVLWILPLLCLHPLWSGLAWTWLAGFLYIVFDPGLSRATWHYPAWAWVWVAQYAAVYALLLHESLGWVRKCDVTNLAEVLLNNKEKSWIQ
jgi:hypothetical protein